MDNQNPTQDPNLSNTALLQAQETSVVSPSAPQPTNPNSTPPTSEPNKNGNTQTLIAVLLLLFFFLFTQLDLYICGLQQNGLDG